MSALLLAELLVCALFVAPIFEVAVAGQVLLGTTFVLTSQALQEMLALYAEADESLYRRLAFYHQVVYTLSCLLSAACAVPLYLVNPRLPMLLTGALIVPIDLVFTLYYARRLSASPAGRFGGLAAAGAALVSTGAGDGEPEEEARS